MRVSVNSIAVAVVLFAGTASADPFTGRYNIESTIDRDVSVSGFIDFLNAPMGTTTFKLGDPFVSGFSIVASGPGLSPLTYDDIADASSDDLLEFNASLGANELTVIPTDMSRRWTGMGDLDDQADGADEITLRQFGPAGGLNLFGSIWSVGEDATFSRADSGVGDNDPHAWRLILAKPVPEPGTLTLLGLAAASVLIRRRRRDRRLET